MWYWYVVVWVCVLLVWLSLAAKFIRLYLTVTVNSISMYLVLNSCCWVMLDK